MAGMYFSSTSSTAMVASGARASADTRPASMFAPNALEAICWPSVPSAAVISLVVVVLPLVPVTRTTCRPRASSDSRSGLSRRPMTPPMTDPSPRPASREARPAAPPTVVARRARRGRPVRREGLLVLISAPSLSGRGLRQVRIQGLADDPVRPGQHDLEPARLGAACSDAHGASHVVQPGLRADADGGAGQVGVQAGPPVRAEQRGPGRLPVAR